MTDNTHQALEETKVGDTAVDGLVAGIVAGIGMAFYLVLTGLLTGFTPAVTMGLFDPLMNGGWLTGLLAHLAVSGIYGVIYALLFTGILRIWPSLLRFGWLIGLVYGLALWALSTGVLLPAAGSLVLQIASVHWLFGHVVYGLVLGYAVSRKR
jgi:hypothetical protein